MWPYLTKNVTIDRARVIKIAFKVDGKYLWENSDYGVRIMSLNHIGLIKISTNNVPLICHVTRRGRRRANLSRGLNESPNWNGNRALNPGL